MTLTRRMALFIALLLLLALGGAWVIHTLGARDALQQQQDMRNRDAAATLALAMSQHSADRGAMQAVATAQFDQGHYQRITLRAPDGRLSINLEQAESEARTPRWFAALLPLQAAPGTALVSSGWTELGTLTVSAHSTWAREALWHASARTAGLLAGLAALAALATTLMLRAWQRPLQATVAQAQALEQGRFVLAPLPSLPELRDLTRSMNATVRRLQDVLSTQAQQVAYLQRRAQLDAVTSLPVRGQFVQGLDRLLAAHGSEGVALVLVRVTQLDKVNQQRGRDAADAVLRALAQVLQAQIAAEPDTLGGRLSGGDFALALPVPGAALSLAPSLHQRLREAVQQAAPGLPVPPRVLVAALEGLQGAQAETLLASASWSLVRAEAGQGLHLEPASPAMPDSLPVQARQSQVAEAVAAGRWRLGEFAVMQREGQLLHLECPLRLQLLPGGDFEPAGRWLPLARRAGLMPQVDLGAISLALQAIAADGQARAVNVALSSLAAPGLVAAVAAQLRAAPAAARALSIEWVDGGQADWAAAEPAIALWRPLGVRMGVEHAGAAPEQLNRLRDLGLDYVKVDGLHLRDVAGDATVNAYARSLVGLIQLLGLKALAEGVDNEADLAMLWQLGFDGATGRALNPAEARASPALGRGLAPLRDPSASPA